MVNCFSVNLRVETEQLTYSSWGEMSRSFTNCWIPYNIFLFYFSSIFDAVFLFIIIHKFWKHKVLKSQMLCALGVRDEWICDYIIHIFYDAVVLYIFKSIKRMEVIFCVCSFLLFKFVEIMNLTNLDIIFVFFYYTIF